jgi:hypothetical protein
MGNEMFVLGLLESVLGESKADKDKANYSFHCPFCNHRKPKLVVNVKTGAYNCWTCYPPTKGKRVIDLLKKLKAPNEVMSEMMGYFRSASQSVSHLDHEAVTLPKEFISLNSKGNSIQFKRAISYLKKRGITQEDVQKYDIGYCEKGRYSNKVIVPSYDKNGFLNYFVARSFDQNPVRKYDAPSVSKTEIIGMEYFINWKVPVILCEGAFDAISIKRNAIPLFGKSIPKSLMLKLVESDVRTIYLALDKDALREALDYSETLINYGKEVYLLDLKGKDPSDIGFERMIQLLHDAKPLTFSNLLYKKMELF